MSCTTSSFNLVLALNTAPIIPLRAEDIGGVPEPLTGATIWFAIKAKPTDTDAEALVFCSTGSSTIAITDAVGGEFQVMPDIDELQASADLRAGATYFAYVKIQFSSGEMRVAAGTASIVDAGIDAP